MSPTFCADCDNVVNDTRKQAPTQWLCRMHPRRFAEGFVHPTYWVEHSPFLRCRDVNAGACPLFVQRRDAEVRT